MTSFPGMLSSCTCLLARLLTWVLAGLPAARTNLFAVEVRKGSQAKHLMSQRPRVERTRPSRGGNLRIFISRRNVLFYGLLPFALPPSHPPGPWAVAHWNLTGVIRSASISEIGNPGLPILTSSPLSGTSLGGLSSSIGERQVWRTLATVGYLPFRKTKMVRLGISLRIRKRRR